MCVYVIILSNLFNKNKCVLCTYVQNCVCYLMEKWKDIIYQYILNNTGVECINKYAYMVIFIQVITDLYLSIMKRKTVSKSNNGIFSMWSWIINV